MAGIMLLRPVVPNLFFLSVLQAVTGDSFGQVMAWGQWRVGSDRGTVEGRQ